MWSNDKCCILFHVSFLVGESLDQTEISEEPPCLSWLSQAKLTFPYLAGCNCRVSNWIIKLKTFHNSTQIYTRGGCSVTHNEPYHCRPLRREQEILVCVIVFLWMGYGRANVLLLGIIQNHGFTVFDTLFLWFIWTWEVYIVWSVTWF